MSAILLHKCLCSGEIYLILELSDYRRFIHQGLYVIKLVQPAIGTQLEVLCALSFI